MSTLLIVGILITAAAIWVARRYKNQGALGLGGIAVALYGLLLAPSGFSLIILMISATLFALGMVVNRSIDDLFHWGALLVNLLHWAWAWVTAIFGWDIWRQTSEVPTVMVVLAFLVIVALIAWGAWWLTQRKEIPSTN